MDTLAGNALWKNVSSSITTAVKGYVNNLTTQDISSSSLQSESSTVANDSSKVRDEHGDSSDDEYVDTSSGSNSSGTEETKEYDSRNTSEFDITESNLNRRMATSSLKHPSQMTKKSGLKLAETLLTYDDRNSLRTQPPKILLPSQSHHGILSEKIDNRQTHENTENNKRMKTEEVICIKSPLVESQIPLPPSQGNSSSSSSPPPPSTSVAIFIQPKLNEPRPTKMTTTTTTTSATTMTQNDSEQRSSKNKHEQSLVVLEQAKRNMYITFVICMFSCIIDTIFMYLCVIIHKAGSSGNDKKMIGTWVVILLALQFFATISHISFRYFSKSCLQKCGTKSMILTNIMALCVMWVSGASFSIGVICVIKFNNNT
jgi:hypothetical protein